MISKRRPQLKNLFQSSSSTASRTERPMPALPSAKGKVAANDSMAASYDDVFGFSEEEDGDGETSNGHFSDQQPMKKNEQSAEFGQNRSIPNADQRASSGRHRLISDLGAVHQRATKSDDQHIQELRQRLIKSTDQKCENDNRLIRRADRNSRDIDQQRKFGESKCSPLSHQPRIVDQAKEHPLISKITTQKSINQKSSNGIIVLPPQSIRDMKMESTTEPKVKPGSFANRSDKPKMLVLTNDHSQSRRLVAVNTPKPPSNFSAFQTLPSRKPQITAPKPSLTMSTSFCAAASSPKDSRAEEVISGNESKVIDSEIGNEQNVEIQGRVKKMKQVFGTLPNPIRARLPIPISKDYHAAADGADTGIDRKNSIDQGSRADQNDAVEQSIDSSSRVNSQKRHEKDQFDQWKNRNDQFQNHANQPRNQSDRPRADADQSKIRAGQIQNRADQSQKQNAHSGNASDQAQNHSDQHLKEHRSASKLVQIFAASLSDKIADHGSNTSTPPGLLGPNSTAHNRAIQSIRREKIDNGVAISNVEPDAAPKPERPPRPFVSNPKTPPVLQATTFALPPPLSKLVGSPKAAEMVGPSRTAPGHETISSSTTSGGEAVIGIGCNVPEASSGNPGEQGETEASPLNDFVWFHGDIDRKVAEMRLLQFNMNGAFLIRYKSTPCKESPYSLSVLQNGKIYHLQIRRKSEGAYALGDRKPNELEFAHLHEIVSYHRRNPLQLIRRKSGELAGLALLTSAPAK